MTIYLTTEQVISIHDLESADPLRDAAALDAAVNASRATWDTHPLHPTVYEQAGVLLRGISVADIDLTAAARWLQHQTQPKTRPCGGRRSPSDGPRPHERDNP